MSSWWPWAGSAPTQRTTTDASHDPVFRNHFNLLPDQTDPPASFKASSVAALLSDPELFALGYTRGEDAMPAIIELAFELRAFGDLEIIKKGKVLGEDVGPEDIEGGIRIRRVAGMHFREVDRWDALME